MSSESVDTRLRKRIVEHVISGFMNAASAIRFGNTMEMLITEKLGEVKFKMWIAAPGTDMAITPEWISDTVLKTIFLEIEDQNRAQFIVERIRIAANRHNLEYDDKIKIETEVVRGKPQPQFMTVDYLPKTTKIHNMG